MNSEELFLIDKKIAVNRDEVIISFGAFNGLDDIHRVDVLMYENIPEDIGNYDGHEVSMDDTDGRLFAYGANAEKLFKIMQPLLKQFAFLERALVYLRFNKEDGTHSEIEFRLDDIEG